MICGISQLVLLAAKGTASAKADEAAKGIWEHLQQYQLPSQDELIRSIESLQTYQAAILLAVGLVYLLQGWRIFKILVIVNFALLGAMIGFYLGSQHSQNWALYGAAIGAVALGVLAWPMMKFAISLMGGLAGAVAGFSIWRYAVLISGHEELVQYSWIGALAGMLLLGILAFYLFRLVIMIFTSVQGSLLAVSGILGLVLKYQPFAKSLRASLEKDPHLLTILVAIPAAIGLLIQAFGHMRSKKKPAEKKEEK